MYFHTTREIKNVKFKDIIKRLKKKKKPKQNNN